jgi:dTDP-4-dehydrorhamnose 3,5-epimerase/CDP-3, 6-dideoxy-D-glycero-D-glycero-4-hexulose-5-epimerase
MIKVQSTPIPGLLILSNPIFSDTRGSFKKVFSKDYFDELSLDSNFVEIYYSISKKDVIRGMHFQLPPMDHIKMVCVIKGKILDVCLDLRRKSITFGKYFNIALSDNGDSYLYIPRGIAHGFASLEDNSIVHYAQTTCYSEKHDCGIRYDSFSFDWPVKSPVISERDRNFPDFRNWNTVF